MDSKGLTSKIMVVVFMVIIPILCIYLAYFISSTDSRMTDTTLMGNVTLTTGADHACVVMVDGDACISEILHAYNYSKEISAGNFSLCNKVGAEWQGIRLLSSSNFTAGAYNVTFNKIYCGHAPGVNLWLLNALIWVMMATIIVLSEIALSKALVN